MNNWELKEVRDDFGDITGDKEIVYHALGTMTRSGQEDTAEFFLSGSINGKYGVQWRFKVRYYVPAVPLSFDNFYKSDEIVFHLKTSKGDVFSYNFDWDLYKAGDIPINLSQLLLQYDSIKLYIQVISGSSEKKYNLSITSNGFTELYSSFLVEKKFDCWKKETLPENDIKTLKERNAIFSDTKYSYESSAFYSEGEIQKVKIEVSAATLDESPSGYGVSITLQLQFLDEAGEFINREFDANFETNRDLLFLEIDGKKYVYHVHRYDDNTSYKIYLAKMGNVVFDVDEIPNEYEKYKYFDNYVSGINEFGDYEKLPFSVLKESRYTKIFIVYPQSSEGGNLHDEFLINGRLLYEIVEQGFLIKIHRPEEYSKERTWFKGRTWFNPFA